MLEEEMLTALRMRRQCLSAPADKEEYDRLYRDTSPVQNVYFHGFGQPPCITFRAAFDDLEYNRVRQEQRILVKGRFQSGNVGFIEAEELELFAGLYRKPYKPSPTQETLLALIRREGPMNIALMKEMTGLLVKEITPALHKLQTAFFIFEDQPDGEWDRGWMRFEEMFPDVDVERYSRQEALRIVLRRFAYRYVRFTAMEAKSFYGLPEKEIVQAAQALAQEGVFIADGDGWLLASDFALLQRETFTPFSGVFTLHRNDFLVKCNEYWLKTQFCSPNADVLQYLLIDGRFRGAVMGRFRYGPYEIENIALTLPEAEAQARRAEMLAAVDRINPHKESPVMRYCGVPL